MITQGERNIQKVDNMCGGKGSVVIEHLLGSAQLNDKCGLYAKVTVGKDCTLGYHTHQGESETYYILSGNGAYDDNGEMLAVGAGDILFCKSGSGHGLANTGADDLVFMALIIQD